MAIKYLTYTIWPVTNIETNEKLYELSHWFISEDKPDIAGRQSIGVYKTHSDAEMEHYKELIIRKYDERNKKLPSANG